MLKHQFVKSVQIKLCATSDINLTMDCHECTPASKLSSVPFKLIWLFRSQYFEHKAMKFSKPTKKNKQKQTQNAHRFQSRPCLA